VEGVSARSRLADGIKAIQQEADGVLGIDVVRQRDMLDLIMCCASGDANALTLLRAVNDTLTNIGNAPRRRPMLCGCCPRSLLDGDFAVVIASPERDDRKQALALAICTACAVTVPAITAKAAEVLRKIWPDLRHIEISATGGHA
jgi:hypothetical protein